MNNSLNKKLSLRKNRVKGQTLKGLILPSIFLFTFLLLTGFASSSIFAGYNDLKNQVSTSSSTSITENDCGSNVAYGLFANGTLKCKSVSLGSETDPYWTLNWTSFNSSWSSMTNLSYATLNVLNNGSYINYAWNSTNTSYALLTQLNNGSYLNLDWLLKSQWNATNTSYMTGDNFTIQNTSQTNLINLNNISLKNYLDSQDISYNNSNNNYLVYSNTTLYQILMNGSFFNVAGGYNDAWINQTIYNKTQVDEINLSMKNYVLYVNSTNGAGGGGSYTPPYLTWINYSTTLLTSTTAVPTYIVGLNTTLQPSSLYDYDCRITFASNITTNGIRVGIRTLTNPPDLTVNIKIPQAGAGTDSFFEHQGDTWYFNVTSTAVVSTAVNYTVQLRGDVYTNGNLNWFVPYFASENVTRLTNVTRAYCKWSEVI